MPKEKAISSRYQSIFKTSIDAIIVIDVRGIIQDINDAGLQLFGYSEDDLLGENVSTLMGEPHHSRHDGYIRNYQQTGDAKIIGIGREVEARKSDGTLFPIRLAVSEFEDQDRIFYTGVIHDLTEEHGIRAELKEYSDTLEQKVENRTSQLKAEIQLKEEAEIKLLQSQQLYEAIAMNFPNGVISVLDKDLNIIFIEGTEIHDSGYDTSKLIGKNYIDLLPDEVKEYCKEQMASALDGSIKVFEIDYDDKAYLARTVLLEEEPDGQERILHVEVNITSQKRAEEEIYKALSKEKQLNELKSRFVSMASHEFRTPLSSIQSSAILIQKYTDSDQQDKRERHVQKVLSNVKNMNMILNDFLSLEKIEAGLIKNNPQSLNLKEFIQDILEETAPLMKTEQSVKTLLEHVDDSYMLDPFLLRNVLNNLLSNAFKYSPDRAEILIHTESIPELCICVQDHGIGISAEDQKQLFNRFFRASNATNIEGTGLGLNTVQRYAEIMGATITFESELNKGSTFKITFHNET